MRSSERSIRLWSSSKDAFTGNPSSSGSRQSADITNLVHAIEAASLRKHLRFQGTETLLDIGAGGGRWTVEFAGDVSSVTAIEPSDIYDVLISNVDRLSNVRCLKVPFEELGEEEQFDCIIISGVLFYIIEDAEVIKIISKIKRLLKPNGVIIMRESVSSKGKTIIDWQAYPPDTPIDLELCQYWEKLRPESFYLEACRNNGLQLTASFPAHAPFFQYLPQSNSPVIRLMRMFVENFFTMRNISNVEIYNTLFRRPYGVVQNLLNMKAFRFYLFRNSGTIQ